VIVNIPTHVVFQNKATSSYTLSHTNVESLLKNQTNKVTVPEVPFYSQFKDISSSAWQKVGCGVTSLAMVIDYYSPDAVSVNKLLKEGLVSGAYQNTSGWSHQGLITLSKKYGLNGNVYDLSKLNQGVAFTQFKDSLKNGPVIVSVHYKFDPKSKIPHLVVINGTKDGVIYYNDPAAKTGEKEISEADFLKGWKQRYIVIRPVQSNPLV
jgi:ABC-type bacteriocin/lantibiotic exporter with double-glycine peptidase domain